MARIYHNGIDDWIAYHDLYIGLDLGKAADHSAVCIVEEPPWIEAAMGFDKVSPRGVEEQGAILEGWVSVDSLTIHQLTAARQHNLHYGRPANPPLRARHLKRYPLRTAYQDVVKDVAAMLRKHPLRGKDIALLMDLGNAGQAVLEMFRHIGIRGVIPVLIHGGYQTSYDPQDGTYKVPKRDLVQAAQVALQNRRLEISGALPDAAVLVEELRNFRGTVSEAGNDRYEARDREHDDLVLALSMAVWFREYRCRHIEASMARHSRGVRAM
jgi:hypothetical protein